MKIKPFDRSWGTRREAVTRAAFLVAPLLMLAYGLVRLLDGLDGTHGPGLAWTVGHVLFLGGLLLFTVVIDGLRRLVPATKAVHRVVATVAAVVGYAGLVAFVRGVVVDIIVGLQAADRPEMSRLFAQYDGDPRVVPAVFYEAGPILFEVAMLVLLAQLAAAGPRLLPVWSPVAFLAGFGVIGADLNLLPLGAALFWLALAPLAWRPERRADPVRVV
ncbi:hypothetical protein, partial [Actinomadura sp. HBU206391]|uniref:hypothetical protein n=1 Tax=Actinomadura sp. HBU206391 TaxID=2731692 RepID=UPI001650544E